MRSEKTQFDKSKNFEVPWYEKSSTPIFQPSAQPKMSGGERGINYSQAAFSDLSATGGLGALAKGLESLNPALQKFQAQFIDRTNKEDTLKAAADQATGKPYDNKNESLAYQETYYKTQAQADALKMNDALYQVHETNKQLGQEEYTKAVKTELDKWINPALRDTPDGQIRAVVLSEIAQRSLSSFNTDYQKTQLGIAQNTFTDNIYALFNKDRQRFVANIPDEVMRDPFARASAIGKYDRERLDYMIPQGKTQGISTADTVMKFAKNSMSQGILENDTAAMEWIFKVGKDGFPATDTALKYELLEMRDHMKQRIHQKTQLEEIDRDKSTKIEVNKTISSLFESLTFASNSADKLKAADGIQELYTKINSDPTRYNPMGAETLNTLMTLKNRLESKFAQFDDNDALRKLNAYGNGLKLEQLEALAPKLTQNTYMMYAGGIRDLQRSFMMVGESNTFNMFSNTAHSLHAEGVAALKPAGIELILANMDKGTQIAVDQMVQSYTAKMGDFWRQNKNTSSQKLMEASLQFQDEVRKAHPTAVKAVDAANKQLQSAPASGAVSKEDVRARLKNLR